MQSLIFGVVTLLTLVVHCLFAWAVNQDADKNWRTGQRKTFLVDGVVWALATLLGGVFVAGVYWAIHYSTLRPPSLEPAPEPAPAPPNLPVTSRPVAPPPAGNV